MSESLDSDLLAAEYVLGSLDAEQASVAERLLAEDAGFRHLVEAWQRRLMPLSALVEPVEPPSDLWERIDASTASPGANVVPLRRVRSWQAGTAAALAVAASLAAFIVLRQPPPPTVAVLTPATGSPVLLATGETGSVLSIRPSGTITVPEGRDLELWALPAGETKPRSLGVLPAGGRKIVARLALDTQLMVSLEPRGGSPTGLPTGPVLYAGRLAALN